jgi:hypothetical protein
LDEQVDQNVQSVVEVGTEYLQKCSWSRKEIKFALLRPVELAVKQDLINGWRLPAWNGK